MWQCSTCQESVEDTFQRCWNCGTDQQGNSDSEFVHADEYRPEFVEEPTVRKFTLATLFAATTVVALIAAIGRLSPLLALAMIAMLISIAVIPLMVKALERRMRGGGS